MKLQVLNQWTAYFYFHSQNGLFRKGGIAHSFEFCLLVLNDFVLIFTFCLFTSAMGHVVASIFEVKNSMDVAQSLASKGKLNDREMLHFNAAKALAAG